MNERPVRSRATAVTLSAMALAACASGAPSVDLPPVAALPAEQPLEWFVENWGPFDPEMIGTVGGGTGALVLLDGVQLEQRDRESLPDDHPLRQISRDDIRHIRLVKVHSGAGLFGEAGCGGVIMIFTHEYEGPMPISPKLANPPSCHRAVRVGEIMPASWFAEQWGPFDASVVGPLDDGPGGYPLLIQDGVQVTPDTYMRGDVFAALTDPDSHGGFMDVRVLKHRCDTRHFGPAGEFGVILAFSTDYEGPLPDRGHAWDGTPCEASGR